LSKKRSHDEDDRTGAKKIKADKDNSTPRKGSTSITWTSAGEPSFKAADISFVVPIRKKLRLELVGTAEGGNNCGIRGINPATGQFEVGMRYDEIGESISLSLTRDLEVTAFQEHYARHTLTSPTLFRPEINSSANKTSHPKDQVILVPVPEKATPQFNFILIPQTHSQSEPIIFTIPSKAPKHVSFREPTENDTYELYIERALNSALASTSHQVISPSSSDFESKSQQGRRKGERLWHVKAHRGSKEGYLYFLKTGILWGFKKPVFWLSFDRCRSVSYTSVLQRTFNMVVTAIVESVENGRAGAETEEEIEFGMIDQVDFEGIDAYIKRHGLNDASLAEGRKAKKYNVNATAASGVGAGDIGDEGEEGGGPKMDAQSLEKALQDAEDEEEEDYEVSGGESEGSGSDSEEEEEGEDRDGGSAEGDGVEEDEEEEAESSDQD